MVWFPSWLLSCLALISSIFSWYSANAPMFLISLALSISFFTAVNLYELSHDSFLLDGYSKMKTDKKCCIKIFKWSTADSVLWLTCAFRLLAASMAVVACYISWENRHRFWNDKQYVMISVAWGVPSMLWLISTIPHIICLVQCAAGQNTKLFAFRKRVTVWLLHDVMLGIFWLYLSCMLYDLADDQDDSEWRTIFLSMLSWHIVIVVLQQIYFTDIWSTSLKVSCCDPEMLPRWQVVIMLISWAVVYAVIMKMLKTNIKMGCRPEDVIIITVAIVFGYFSKTNPPELNKTRLPVRQNNRGSLYFWKKISI